MKIEDRKAEQNWNLTTKASKNPFSTPDGYFDSLPDRLLTRLHSNAVESASTNTIRNTKIRTINTIRSGWGYAAAMVLLFSIGGYLYYNDISTLESRYANVEEYNNDYFDELYYNLDIDDYTIYNYLASSNTDF